MYIDDPIRNSSYVSRTLENLEKESKNDRKFIKEYYNTKNTNWKEYPILDIFKSLFLYINRKYTFIENIIMNLFMCISYLFLNSSILKLGYDYFIYSWILLSTFIIFLVYINFVKYKGFILTFIIYLSSIFLTNHIVYNASKEGIYKKEYCKIVKDNNLTEFDFFIENIQQLNLFKTKEK